MKLCRALKDEVVLADQIRMAVSFFEKLVGLLRDKAIDSQQGLLICGCKQVHTMGMKFPIDVIFLSKEGEILHIENNLLNSSMSKYIKKAFYALELKSGFAKKHNLMVHDHILFEGISENQGGK
ncbi:MAG: DUF192 domain-containing protein [Acetobacterium sp.]